MQHMTQDEFATRFHPVSSHIEYPIREDLDVAHVWGLVDTGIGAYRVIPVIDAQPAMRLLGFIVTEEPAEPGVAALVPWEAPAVKAAERAVIVQQLTRFAFDLLIIFAIIGLFILAIALLNYIFPTTGNSAVWRG